MGAAGGSLGTIGGKVAHAAACVIDCPPLG
jgi:hypothetical protein